MQNNEQVISKKAKELEEKYLSPISINENILRTKKKKTQPKSPLRKAINIVFDIICTLLILIAAIMCFDTAVSYVDKVAPAFFGYSNMRVVSGSMLWSGFEVNDVVVIRAVKPRTLRGGGYRVGDMISFYHYTDYDSTHFDVDSARLLTEDEYADHVQYDYSPSTLLGFRSNLAKEAAQAGSLIIFHHIKDIYVDANGDYWFKTYGSSNADPIRASEGDTLETHVQQEIGSEITMGLDSWYVHEDLVLGVYDDSAFAKGVSTMVSAVSASGGIILLLIPILLIAIVIIKQSIRDIQLARLEMAVVEEKMKLTDDICISNNLGFRMDQETKFKVLTQADESQWDLYISLLWKTNEIPPAVKEYQRARSILLAPNVKLLALNRECERRFKEGENPIIVTEHYIKEKEKLASDQLYISRALKHMPKDFTLEQLDHRVAIERSKGK